MSERVTVGTRGSDLALVQAAMTERALLRAFPDLMVRRKVIRTTGDRRTDVSLAEVAKAEGVFDKGVFTKELEVALEAGEIDLAVHSLKDVPTVLDEEFEIAGTLPRAPIRDVLVSGEKSGLKGLKPGAVVGTSSVRRAKQLLWLRPDLKVADIRGNVPTRIAKLAAGQYDAILLAEAGLVRLGHDMGEVLRLNGREWFFAPLMEEEFYPAAGQGAIGIEIRAGDDRAKKLAEAISDEATFVRTRAEREFLRLLDAGCHTPVGAFTRYENGRLEMAGRVFPESGGEPVSGTAAGSDPLVVAAELHRSLA